MHLWSSNVALVVLCLVAVHCAPPPIDEWTKQKLVELFGSPKENSTVQLPVRFNNDTGINLTATVVGNKKECMTKDKEKGVCVLYYQCDADKHTVIDDGSTLIDLRDLDECPNFLDVCCLRDKVKKERPPPKKSNKPADECGWSNPGAQSFRILNDGTIADYGEYPWMVAILKKSETTTWSQSDFLGGGSIIHPSVVLTAAHKVDSKAPKDIKCRGGEWDTQTEQEEHPHQERDVKKIVKHDDYYRPSLYNDIALLFLERPFELSKAPHMAVACVGTDPPAPGTLCESMGWGKEFNSKDKYAVVLKKVVVPAVARDRCQNALRGTRLGAYFMLHTSLTCAGGELGKDTCTGDGGAPLVCPIKGAGSGSGAAGRYAVYGLVAWGIGCGTGGVPGVYVNVPELRDWLGDRMADEGYDDSSYSY